jgi:hypothetical protein
MTPFFIVTLGDVFGIVLFLLLAVAAGLVLFWHTAKQFLCRHDQGVTETMSCDAVCKKCGKNLGFIGKRRDRESTK